MAEDSKIQWCDHTWSPWRGCTKVSAGCKNCYAEKLSHRNPAVLGEWGKDGRRVVNADWRKPLAWDRKAAKAGTRLRVFPSLCDWLEDRPDLDATLGRFLELIDATPNLDWLLLTKRPELFRKRLRAAVDTMPRTRGPNHTGRRWNAVDWLQAGEPSGRSFPPNVWVGTSTEDQPNADARIPALLEIPAAVRFVSAEPLLGPINMRTGVYAMPPTGTLSGTTLEGIDWLIVGGESGPQARPCDVAWVRSLRDQCRAAGVPVFVKQLGAKIRSESSPHPGVVLGVTTTPLDSKGGDPGEWPADLRVREMPRAATTQPDDPHPDARDPYVTTWAKLGGAR
jgi:protein gp37